MLTFRTSMRPPSRRDEHKNQTRRALREAALRLFSSQGYDATTTDEIAERAAVSPRTFFRYFPTKESVLLIGRHGFVQAFIGVYLAQPAAASHVDAMCASFRVLAPGMACSRQALLLYEEAVASSATLRGRVHDHVVEDTAALAEAVATRRGLSDPDESCALLAAVGLLANRRALDRWLAGPASVALDEVVADEFGLLADLFVES
jgi:AcrR family transcriptional regulator